jgi:hypothetical protein
VEKQSAKKCICIKGELFMIVPRYYEDLSVLHENTMPARAYFIPASKRMDIAGCVFDFERCGNNFTERPHNSNHTFTFRNIDTYCVHKLSLLKIIAMDKYQFYSLPIQSTVV